MTTNSEMLSGHSAGRVLIVGAGPGLGMAFARRALAGGSDVTLAARSADTLDEMVTHLGPDGGRVATLVVDASQPTCGKTSSEQPTIRLRYPCTWRRGRRWRTRLSTMVSATT